MANASVDEIIALGKQKGVDMSKYEQKLRQKYSQTGVPTDSFGQMPQAQPQAQDQASQVERIMKSLQPSLAEKVANAGMMVFGGKPIDNGMADIRKFAQEQGMKKLFEDPEEKLLKQESTKALIESRQAGIGRGDFNQEQKMLQRATQLRGELTKDPYIDKFKTMNSAAKGIDSILRDTIGRKDLKSKNIGDQATITLYNKLLDPLSVVRESEYARTPEGMALLNRIQGFVEKVGSGGSGLTDQDRIEVARAAKVLLNNAGELYNSSLDRFTGLANEYQVAPEKVLYGMDRFTPYDVTQSPMQAGQITSWQSPVVQQGDPNDPIVRTGTDKDTNRKIGQTKSGKMVYL